LAALDFFNYLILFDICGCQKFLRVPREASGDAVFKPSPTLFPHTYPQLLWINRATCRRALRIVIGL